MHNTSRISRGRYHIGNIIVFLRHQVCLLLILLLLILLSLASSHATLVMFCVGLSRSSIRFSCVSPFWRWRDGGGGGGGRVV